MTATDTQSSEEIYALMGVWGEAGLTNYNDHFWDRGELGPDISKDAIQGFWRLTGVS
ncbi:MAG: DUF6345 domain-containing protein [Deinococcales bacterium]